MMAGIDSLQAFGENACAQPHLTIYGSSVPVASVEVSSGVSQLPWWVGRHNSNR